MADQEDCHLCECSEHAEELYMKQTRIRADALNGNVDSLKTLLDFSQWYKRKGKCTAPLSPAGIFQRSCDSHQVFNSKIWDRFHKISLEVLELFIEKGFDVNAQTHYGSTPLHLACDIYRRDVGIDLEVVSMLLWYGADPMIRNDKGFTAFDILIMARVRYYDRKQNQADLPLIQHLFYLTLDEYTEWDIDAEVFMSAYLVDSWIFEETMKTNIREVVFRDNFSSCFLYFTSNNPTKMLMTMKPQCLQMMIEKFDYVIKELLVRPKCFNLVSKLESPIWIENVDILLDSKLKLEFMNWLLSNVDIRCAIQNFINYRTELSSVQKFTCFLLSRGIDLDEKALFLLFRFHYYVPYCYEMFKIFLHMNVIQTGQDSANGKQFIAGDILPRMLYYVTLDIPKMIEQRLLTVECLVDLLPYFTIPSDFFTGSDWEKLVQGPPQVPLLIELARNVFRKYFIQKLGITNASQFYTVIRLLRIPAHHVAIITYEAKLYPDFMSTICGCRL